MAGALDHCLLFKLFFQIFILISYWALSLSGTLAIHNEKELFRMHAFPTEYTGKASLYMDIFCQVMNISKLNMYERAISEARPILETAGS